MIGFPKLGMMGRLGNQLFQIASTIGIADANETRACFPHWKYEGYFQHKLPFGVFYATHYEEVKYEYNDVRLYEHANISGYLQSYKYFEHCEEKIRQQFTFEQSFYNRIYEKYILLTADYEDVLAVHIRRGDYVSNPNYVQLGDDYYYEALQLVDSDSLCILVFTDGSINPFPGLENIRMADGTDIEDLCMMTMCDYHIIANSSFSWWGAWLSKSKQVIRPKQHFAGELAKRATTETLYPPNWIAV